MISLLLILALQAVPVPAPPVQPAPTPAPVQAPTADPAVAQFATPIGLLLVPVKADRVRDYEAAILTLQQGFQKSTDDSRRAMANGWRVYRAAELDAKNNVLYVHVLFPTVAGADYRPSLLLDELLQGAPAPLLAKYRDALAGAPSKLSLSELAFMGAATPVK